MPEEVVPASEGVPPTPDAAAAPSAEEVLQEPVSQQTPAPPSQPVPEGEPPFHQHPRWIERQQELERGRVREADLQRQNQLLLETMQRVALPPAPPVPVDPWEGLVNHPAAETAQFWQQQRRLMEHHERVAEAKAVQRLQPVIDAGRSEIAYLKTERFREQNPEIKVGSEEERLVAGYLQQGYDLETAKQKTLYPRLEAENRALKATKATVPQKRAAAQVDATSGIPQTAGLPPKPGGWEERASDAIDAGGDMRDAAAAAFGVKRRS